MDSQRSALVLVMIGLFMLCSILGCPLYAQEAVTSPRVSSQSLLQDPRAKEAIHLMDVWLDAQWVPVLT